MTQFNNKHLIHTVLGHAYIFFLVFFCLAIVTDRIYPIGFGSVFIQYLGMAFVFLGTVGVFWAQRSSKKSVHVRLSEERTHESFAVGPYAFLHTPTQTSLFLMMCGLGFVIDIAWISVFSVVALVLNYFIFIKKQERILEKRYGESYKTYRSKI